MDTATVDIVQCYCDVCGGYFGYSNSRYTAMLLWCDGGYFVYSNSTYSAMVLCFLEFNLVSATVDIVQSYCVVCGDYCGYSNSRYSAMILYCVEFIVVRAT